MELNKISKHFQIKQLTISDSDDIFSLCKENVNYYKYFFDNITKTNIIDDLFYLPTMINKETKYVIGFYKEDILIAIMDFVDGYPNKHTIYIGLFMLKIQFQNNGIGSLIINDFVDFAKEMQYKDIKLAWIDENTKAKNFWIKNGFRPLDEKMTKGKYPRKVIEATREL